MPKQRTRARVVLLVTGILAVVFVGAVVRYRDELVAWYVFRRDFESIGKNEQGLPEYRHRQTGIVFVGLPGGTFMMGSPEGEADREKSEGPVHKVTLSPFLIAKYEVSQAKWKKVMGYNPSVFRGDTRAVEEVSWDDCQEFGKKTGLSLPTEALWEYACIAGSSGAYAGTGKLDYMGWYIKIGRSRPHPVGEKQPNDFGLHDMHGSVWEWCEDWYQEDFYRGSTGARDPLCESAGSTRGRVMRGGSYSSDARRCRSAKRFWEIPSHDALFVGFRPAWSSPPAEAFR